MQIACTYLLLLNFCGVVLMLHPVCARVSILLIDANLATWCPLEAANLSVACVHV